MDRETGKALLERLIAPLRPLSHHGVERRIAAFQIRRQRHQFLMGDFGGGGTGLRQRFEGSQVDSGAGETRP